MLTYAIMLDICTICDNADRIKESSKYLGIDKCQQSETGSVCEAQLPQSHQNQPYQITKDSCLLHFYCIINK